VTETAPAPPAPFDVAVIGAGVVGTAIARELSHFRLRTVLLEGADDVGTGTSKANTAIWHTGFDAAVGSLEGRLLRRGHQLLGAYAGRTGIPVERVGALLVAWSDEEAARLPTILADARRAGHRNVRAVGTDELPRLEPELGPGARGGLLVPDEGILCPFTTPLAFATEAVVNGVELRLGTSVVGAAPGPAAHRLLTTAGPVDARHVVNAAGLEADTIDALFGRRRFTVAPRRGQLVVFDTWAARLLGRILLPVPGRSGKGVLIAPTVFGNVVLGPTAEPLGDRRDTRSTVEGVDALLRRGRRVLPRLLEEEVTAVYAGLRAATEHRDYQIDDDPGLRYVVVGGIRSTGVSSSMAIAEHVRDRLQAMGLPLRPAPDHEEVRMASLGERQLRSHRDGAAIAADPDAGRIVCHCERVTRAECLAACRAPVPARSLDGLRRRTRAMLGRCQGFHCSAAVVGLLAEATGRSPSSLVAPSRGERRGPGPGAPGHAE